MVFPAAKCTYSNIKDTSLTVTSQQGESDIVARRFVYGLSGGSVMDHTYVNAPNTNPFSKSIGGLQPNTLYEFTAHVADGPRSIDWGPYGEWTTVRTYYTPPAPDAPTFSSVTSSSLSATFTTNGSGGAPILEYQLGYSNSSLGPTSYRSGAPPETITGLARATTYYFWSRIRTNVGWSGWSSRASVKTASTIPDKPAKPIPGTITQTTIQVKNSDPNNGGSTVLERQLSYYAPPSGGSVLLTSDRDDTITGLLPATSYSFRYRVRNAVGWSSWSDYLTVRTSAGVWIKVSGVWKEAVVWVNVNGTWKRARPWGKILGSWKETK
jgi:hypothetical protein